MLGSAALHALWNWLIAAARDSHAATAVALVTATLAFAPVAVLSWELDSDGRWHKVPTTSGVNAQQRLQEAAAERARAER